MHFVRTRQFLATLTEHPDAGLISVSPVASTNDWFREQPELSASPGEFTVVVSDWQTTGRGRLGRVWESPAGKCLAMSVLLRPADHGLAPNQFSWLPLMAGLAVCQALNTVAGQYGMEQRPFSLKWPNDVLALSGHSEPDAPPFRKISGVLSELQPDGSVILGIGINLLLESDELPVPTATSFTLVLTEATSASHDHPATAETLFDEVASTVLTELHGLYQRLLAASGDAVAAGIRSEVAAELATLNQKVRVDLPAGRQQLGTVIGLGAQGELLLTADDGTTHSVLAGDITHLRPA